MGGVYDKVGNQCVNSSCSVDLYLFNDNYSDIATLSSIPSLSGGDVYKSVLLFYLLFICYFY